MYITFTRRAGTLFGRFADGQAQNFRTSSLIFRRVRIRRREAFSREPPPDASRGGPLKSANQPSRSSPLGKAPRRRTTQGESNRGSERRSNGKTRMSLIIWESRKTSFLVVIDAEVGRRSINRAATRKRLLRFAPFFHSSLPNPRLFTVPKIKTDIPDSTLVYPKLPKFTTKKKLFSKIFTTFPPLLSNTEFQLSPSKGLIGLSKKER